MNLSNRWICNTLCFPSSQIFASIDRFRDSLKICLTMRSRYTACKRWKIGRTWREVAKKRRRFFSTSIGVARLCAKPRICAALRWLVTVNVNHEPTLAHLISFIFARYFPSRHFARERTCGRVFALSFFYKFGLIDFYIKRLILSFYHFSFRSHALLPCPTLAQSRCISMETAN